MLFGAPIGVNPSSNKMSKQMLLLCGTSGYHRTGGLKFMGPFVGSETGSPNFENAHTMVVRTPLK